MFLGPVADTEVWAAAVVVVGIAHKSSLHLLQFQSQMQQHYWCLSPCQDLKIVKVRVAGDEDEAKVEILPLVPYAQLLLVLEAVKLDLLLYHPTSKVKQILGLLWLIIFYS